MRRRIAGIFSWLARVWSIVGLALIAFVLLEGAYRAVRLVRNTGGGEPAVAVVPSIHPHAGDAWFVGWYEQSIIRGGMVFDPYRANRRAPGHAPGVTIDSSGRRVTVQADGTGAVGRRLFLLGGSTMWGYTARDSATIPSLVAAKLRARGVAGVEVVNLAQPGYNATQEVATLLLALRDGEIPAAAVFLTTHKDIYAAYQNGRPGGITSEGVYAALFEDRPPDAADEFRALARRSALGARWISPSATTGSSVATPAMATPTAAICTGVAKQYRELARLADAMGREYGFPVFFLRQPMLASTKKPLSAWEGTLARPRHEALYRQCMATIDSTMRGLTSPAYQSLASLFDADSASVFLDEYGYLTERAGGTIATRIVDLVAPTLLRGRRAAPR